MSALLRGCFGIFRFQLIQRGSLLTNGIRKCFLRLRSFPRSSIKLLRCFRCIIEPCFISGQLCRERGDLTAERFRFCGIPALCGCRFGIGRFQLCKRGFLFPDGVRERSDRLCRLFDGRIEFIRAAARIRQLCTVLGERGRERPDLLAERFCIGGFSALCRSSLRVCGFQNCKLRFLCFDRSGERFLRFGGFCDRSIKFIGGFPRIIEPCSVISQLCRKRRDLTGKRFCFLGILALFCCGFRIRRFQTGKIGFLRFDRFGQCLCRRCGIILRFCKTGDLLCCRCSRLLIMPESAL